MERASNVTNLYSRDARAGNAYQTGRFQRTKSGSSECMTLVIRLNNHIGNGELTNHWNCEPRQDATEMAPTPPGINDAGRRFLSLIDSNLQSLADGIRISANNRRDLMA